MAHFMGAAMRLKVKPDALLGVKAFVEDWIVNQDLGRHIDTVILSGAPGKSLNTVAIDLIKFTGLAQPDMGTYGWFLVEDEADGKVYTVTSAAKYFDEDIIVHALTELLPYLVVKDGDILYRHVYDDYIDEVVLIVHEGKIRACHGLAYYDNEYVEDPRHPYNFSWEETPAHGISDWHQFKAIPREERYMYVVGLITPPWTMAEVNAQNEETLAKRQVAPFRQKRTDPEVWMSFGQIWLRQ